MSRRPLSPALVLTLACVLGSPASAQAVEQTTTPAAGTTLAQLSFETPEAACEALIRAAADGDTAAMQRIFGPQGMDLVVTEDPVHDRNQAAAFAEQARIRNRVVREPDNPERATLLVGTNEWPMPIPIVKDGGSWRFDTAAGRLEILFRRIGENELGAIDVCRGYVEAQREYALGRYGGTKLSVYAQHIISTPGTRNGLAWQAEDGSWQGPVGEGIARIIAEGYTERYAPYHGYYFKVLKGQGPDAPLGQLDFVVEEIMIGGFALVAAPANYEVTGVMTFIVSHDGVVHQKDLGPGTYDRFREMERYNPDPTWLPVESP